MTLQQGPALPDRPTPTKWHKRKWVGVSTPIGTGEVIATLHLPCQVHEPFQVDTGHMPGITISTPDRANVCLNLGHCHCGAEVVNIVALRPVLPSQPLALASRHPNVQGGTHILLQFDGSCLQPASPLTSAGAGVACWKIQNASLTLIDLVAIMLPNSKSAPASEASGSSWAVTLLPPLLQQHQPTSIEIQGDNKAIIGYWQGDSRIKKLQMWTLMEHARTRLLLCLPPITFTHIPRECNKSADFAAGIASAALLQLREDSHPGQRHEIPVEDVLFRPINIRMHSQQSWCSTAAQALGDHSTNTLELQEQPDLRQIHRVLKLAYWFPSHRKGLRPYLEYVGYGQQSRPIIVQYQGKAEGLDGRLYPQVFGVKKHQNCPHAPFLGIALGI